MFRAMQTSPFKNMRTNLWPRNLTTGPCYLTLISHLWCINMCVLHTSTFPRGACMALVPHCDTNQGRWRTALSCKHQSLLVLFKCLPSLILLCLTLASPSTPRLQPPLSASPSLSSPSKSACREKREPSRAEAAAEADLPPGGQPVSQCVGLFPGPTETISYSNVAIRPLTHWGLFMAAAPGRRVKMVI